MVVDLRTGICLDCRTGPPLCDGCHAEIIRTLRGTAWVWGLLWGRELHRLIPEPRKPWPAYDSEAAEKLRRIARKKVASLARGDERTIEVLARACAEGAEQGYREG